MRARRRPWRSDRDLQARIATAPAFLWVSFLQLLVPAMALFVFRSMVLQFIVLGAVHRAGVADHRRCARFMCCTFRSSRWCSTAIIAGMRCCTAAIAARAVFQGSGAYRGVFRGLVGLQLVGLGRISGCQHPARSDRRRHRILWARLLRARSGFGRCAYFTIAFFVAASVRLYQDLAAMRQRQ